MQILCLFEALFNLHIEALFNLHIEVYGSSQIIIASTYNMLYYCAVAHIAIWTQRENTAGQRQEKKTLEHLKNS